VLIEHLIFYYIAVTVALQDMRDEIETDEDFEEDDGSPEAIVALANKVKFVEMVIKYNF